MKKFFILPAIMLLTLASISSAFTGGTSPYGVGAKYAAMGGAGSAIVDDIYSTYYNPAGIIKSGYVGLNLNSGAATANMTEMVELLSNATNPAKFFSDNFTRALDINGGLTAALGLNIGKMGFSAISLGNLVFKKDANSLSGGSLAAGLNYELAGTFAYTVNIPYLSYIPFTNVDLGLNFKSVNRITASTSIESAIKSTDKTSTYSGMGYDLGLKGQIDLPLFPISIGLVFKDLGETLTGKEQTITTNYGITGNITSQITAEAALPASVSPVTTVIGASATIPMGIFSIFSPLPISQIKISDDMEFVGGSNPFSINHLGIEVPIMFGLIHLRGGMVSGGSSASPISMTTYGAGFWGVNVAMTSDANNSKNNSTLVDLSISF